MPGTLFVIATPIGNLEDISARALRVLGEVAIIAAEDTRVTRKLLSHYGIHTPLTSCHAHTQEEKVEILAARLAAEEDLALVSDAGTPGISDPGAALVRAAWVAGARVVPIPGPSAGLAALCACGLDSSRFLFEGFLPRARGERKKVLTPLRALPHTLVFYEAAARVGDTLRVLREELGNRPAAVGRELTKKFEELARGTLEQLERRYREEPPRGECVLLVSGAPVDSAGGADPSLCGAAEEPVDLESRLRELLGAGTSVRDAAKRTAAEFQLSRRETYARAQELAEALSTPGEAG